MQQESGNTLKAIDQESDKIIGRLITEAVWIHKSNNANQDARNSATALHPPDVTNRAQQGNHAMAVQPVASVTVVLYARNGLFADMTRQYKAMQNEMSIRISQLDADLTRTRAQLGKDFFALQPRQFAAT